MFGYYSYFSKKSNFNYRYNIDFKVEIVEIYYKEIFRYLKNICDKNKDVDIKYITNLNKFGKEKFKTEIIVTCKKK